MDWRYAIQRVKIAPESHVLPMTGGTLLPESFAAALLINHPGFDYAPYHFGVGDIFHHHFEAVLSRGIDRDGTNSGQPPEERLGEVKIGDVSVEHCAASPGNNTAIPDQGRDVR